MEIEVHEDFLSFDADLVAEQLTYMDAVSGGKCAGHRGGRVCVCVCVVCVCVCVVCVCVCVCVVCVCVCVCLCVCVCVCV